MIFVWFLIVSCFADAYDFVDVVFFLYLRHYLYCFECSRKKNLREGGCACMNISVCCFQSKSNSTVHLVSGLAFMCHLYVHCLRCLRSVARYNPSGTWYPRDTYPWYRCNCVGNETTLRECTLTRRTCSRAYTVNVICDNGRPTEAFFGCQMVCDRPVVVKTEIPLTIKGSLVKPTLHLGQVSKHGA